MSTERWEHIKRAFNAAMERPAAERAAFVEETCGDDTELKREVLSLIQAARPTLEGGPVRTAGAVNAFANASPSAFTAVQLTERAGSVVGHYKLLQSIGEGGFGTVFLADQTAPVRRRVALKIIKLGMDTRSVVARFEAERQALALMDHPNIARVFDAGSTDSGRPYFVMEYVKGDPITLFADAHTLTLRERLELLTQVCHAVQHAHQKGVIHRDIKPSNVLVSMVDGKPLAKVIDFGIAKATGAAGGTLTDKTLFTEHRALIGTPEYMSPEQAEGSPDIDTRTDVYGLGVLMYELLTGTTPFEPSRLRSAAYAEMQRIIKEEEPPSPSLRISRDLQRDLQQLASTAAHRKVEPQRLNTLMRGELDWIVMKALDKDRARRFATPQDLAADIDRHLRGEAVVAAPASAAYRVRKFVRRNKGAVGTVTAVILALAAGGSVAAWQWNLHSTLADQASRALTSALISKYDKPGEDWDVIDDIRDSEGEIVARVSADGKTVGARRLTSIAVLDLDNQWMRGHEALSVLQLAASQGFEELRSAKSSLEAQVEVAEWSAYTANLALAQAAMDAGNYPEARKRLADAPKSKQGWEWKVTQRQAELYRYSQLQRNGLYRLSIDGKHAFFSGFGDDYKLRLESRLVADGSLLRQFQSPIALPGPYGYMSTPTGFQTTTSLDKLPSVSAPKNAFLIGRDVEGNVLVLDTERNVKLPPSGEPEFKGKPVAMNASGDALVIADQSGDLVVWVIGETKPFARIDTAESDVTAVAISGDRQLVWAGSASGDVSFYAVSGGSKVTTIRTHQRSIRTIAVSPDSNLIASASEDGSVQIWRSDLSAIETAYHLYPREPQSLSFSPDGAWVAVATEFDVRVLGVDEPHTRFVIPQHWGNGYSDTNARFTADGQALIIANQYASDGNSSELSVVELAAEGGPKQSISAYEYSDPETWRLAFAAILTSSPNGPSGLTITTPDGTRRIVGGSDKTVRFYEAKPAQIPAASTTSPDAPAAAPAPEPAPRELAVFRMPEAVTNLQMTADGTRLIISLEDGSARVWDIREPEERRNDMQAKWAERVPAGQYLDSQWSTQVPTDKLRDTIIADATLTPLRRLVAVEMLQERIDETNRAAEEARNTLTKDATPNTDPTTIQAAAAATDLPPRVKEKLLSLLSDWQPPAAMSEAERKLAEETQKRQAAESDANMQRELAADAAAFSQCATFDSDEGAVTFTKPATRAAIEHLTRLSKVTSLKLDGEEYEIGDETLHLVAERAANFTNLSKLFLSDTQATKIGLNSVTNRETGLKNLTMLSLFQNEYDADLIEAVASKDSKHNLSRIDLYGSSTCTWGIQVLSQKDSILNEPTTLTLIRPGLLSADKVRSIAGRDSALHRLALHLTDPIMDSGGIKALADGEKGVKNVVSLELHKALTDDDLAAIAHQSSGLKALSCLTISCENVTDAGFAVLAAKDSGLKSLVELCLYDAKLLTETGCAEFARSDSGLSRLKKLVIGGGITDAGLAALARKDSGLKALTELDLRGARVTDAGLAVLARQDSGLTGLTRLRINGQNFTDAGLASLASATTSLKSLTTLDLTYAYITDSGISALADANTGLKSLKEVDLTGTQVTDAGVATLKTRFPDLKITR